MIGNGSLEQRYLGPARVEAKIDDLQLNGGRYGATALRDQYEELYGPEGIG